MLDTLGDDADASIAAAVAMTEHEMRAVPASGTGRDEWEAAIDERLRRLAVKVLPTAAPAQTKEWRTMMVEALSNLPAMVALTAAKKAIHEPFRFIGEIEPAIRSIAAAMIEKRNARLKGLERMQADIERARRAPAALPAADPDREITAEEIRAMKPELRSMGLKAGFITQDQVDAAFAVDEQLAA